jgi:translation initiation factor IF-2
MGLLRCRRSKTTRHTAGVRPRRRSRPSLVPAHDPPPKGGPRNPHSAAQQAMPPEPPPLPPKRWAGPHLLPNALARTKPSPAGPKPLPGVVTMLHFSRISANTSQLGLPVEGSKGGAAGWAGQKGWVGGKGDVGRAREQGGDRSVAGRWGGGKGWHCSNGLGCRGVWMHSQVGGKHRAATAGPVHTQRPRSPGKPTQT